MAATQQQATDALIKTNEVLSKVSNEIDGLHNEVATLKKELEAAGGAGGTITPELEAAVKATYTRSQAMDELTEDMPQPEAAKKK